MSEAMRDTHNPLMAMMTSNHHNKKGEEVNNTNSVIDFGLIKIFNVLVDSESSEQADLSDSDRNGKNTLNF